MSEWIPAKIVERIAWTDTLISLRFEAAIGPFQAGQFVRVGLDIDGERVGRPYSLVNAPHESLHEIYFNIVEQGPLTPRLAGLQVGESFWVVPKASGFLTLDEVPTQTRDLWLLATGTAIGPFLSMLKTELPWQRFAHVVLGHSVRLHNELSYTALVQDLLKQHPKQLQFVPFVTREAADGALSQRIPQSIEDGTLEAKTDSVLAPENTHVLLCGNSAMLQDTLSCLEKRGMRRHRRREPGHVGMEKYH